MTTSTNRTALSLLIAAFFFSGCSQNKEELCASAYRHMLIIQHEESTPVGVSKEQMEFDLERKLKRLEASTMVGECVRDPKATVDALKCVLKAKSSAQIAKCN